MIPSVVVIAATQSRKALVFLIVGVLGYAFIKAQKSPKSIFIKGFKIMFWILILSFVFYWILQLGILKEYENAWKRVERWFGNGQVDHSTIVRNNLKTLGIEWFLRYPFGGIGIANPHILANYYYAFDAYLHDNFVELLCGGGIIGFSVYYSMYVYLLYSYGNIEKQIRRE